VSGSSVSLSYAFGLPRRLGITLMACILLTLPATFGCTQIAAPINQARCRMCAGSGRCNGCGGDGLSWGNFVSCQVCEKTGKCGNCDGWGFGGDK
jgi:hypothetical protein